MSRYLTINAPRPAMLFSAEHSQGFPFRHSLQAVKMDLKGGTFWAEWDEEIAQSRENRNETLQASW
jgi:hypothetical protein